MHMGRIDSQVKLRGQRIELGEIEAASLEEVSVQEAAAHVVSTSDGSQRLVLYMSPMSVDERHMQRYLRTRLPRFMAPEAIVRMERLPLNPNGKTDRAQLPTPAMQAAANANTVAPRSASESAAREAIAGVLRLDAESVSVEASFEELGGNSLRAVLLSRALCAALGREVAVAEVLQRPTVAQLVDKHEGTLLIAASSLDRPTAALYWLTPPSSAEESSYLSNALICIHDFTGQLWAFRDFARHANRPCLGLRCTSQIVDGCTTTRQLAIHYARELQDVLPPGSTARLVGYSAGCQIAYRIALTLEAAGMPVQLVLLDGRLPALNDASAVGGAAARVDETVAVLRHGADPQFASAAPDHTANSAEKTLLRLGAMLGDDGCTLADMLLRLTDEAPADLGEGRFGGATVYLKTRGNALASPIKDTRIVDGGHFDFMLDHATEVAHVVGSFFAD
jgi:thioesterase domain-containing protein/acyl carrier protein